MPPATSSPLTVYGLLVLAGLLGAGSDVVLNRWASTGRFVWLLSAYASWMIVATVLGLILRLRYFGFGTAVVLFLLVNSIGALIIDRAAFSVRLSFWGWAGLALALAAIVLVELGRGHRVSP